MALAASVTVVSVVTVTSSTSTTMTTTILLVVKVVVEHTERLLATVGGLVVGMLLDSESLEDSKVGIDETGAVDGKGVPSQAGA